MQLATPFLITPLAEISERSSKKPTTAKTPQDSTQLLANDQAIDQNAQEVTIEAPSELAHQNLARLLASCGDCV